MRERERESVRASVREREEERERQALVHGGESSPREEIRTNILKVVCNRECKNERKMAIETEYARVTCVND